MKKRDPLLTTLIIILLLCLGIFYCNKSSAQTVWWTTDKSNLVNTNARKIYITFIPYEATTVVYNVQTPNEIPKNYGDGYLYLTRYKHEAKFIFVLTKIKSDADYIFYYTRYKYEVPKNQIIK